jgi:hypothetical protein
MKYTVTRADAERASALVPLWSANLPIESDPYAKYRWYYLENPSGPGEAVVLQHEEQATKRCVGAEGIGVRIVSLNGEPVRAGLLADFALEREHRTVLPALTLQRAVCAHCRAAYVFAYGFPNEHAVGVFSRAGYRRLGRMTRYAYVLRHASYVARRVPRAAGIATSAAGSLLDVPARLSRLARGLARRGLELRWPGAAAIDERFDALWSACRHVAPVIGRRDAAHVRWRFFARPGSQSRVATLEEAKTSRLRGYAIVERLDAALHVRDLLARTEEDTLTFLDRLASAARGEGASSLSMRTLTGTRLADLLVEYGFSPRESARSMMVDVGRSISGESTGVLDARRWYVTDGDEDT